MGLVASIRHRICGFGNLVLVAGFNGDGFALSPGWRAAFGAYAAFGFAVVVAGCRWLPAVKAKAQSSSGGFPHGNTRLYHAIIVTGLIIAAHFCAYTYIAPLLERVAGVSKSEIPLLLLVFGGAGAAGTLIAGWTGQRPAVLALLAAVGIVGSEMLMAVGKSLPSFASLEMILWVSLSSARRTSLGAGTKVFGFVAQGAWAEFVKVRSGQIVEIPPEFTVRQASALPAAGVTAMVCLEKAGPLLGRRVLITGAAGGVGRFACQLAALSGASVFAVSRRNTLRDQLAEDGGAPAAIFPSAADARAAGV
jgi:hypothetical protein